VNGDWRKFLLGLLVTVAGVLMMWDRENLKQEIEKLRTEDKELRGLIRAHATEEGLMHKDFLERFRSLERAVFGEGGK